MLNILTKKAETDKGKVPEIKSELYGDWKNAIEKFVLHLGQRGQEGKSNMRKGKHLNDMIPCFGSEVVRCWQQWIDSDLNNKGQLEEILSKCRTSAQQDMSKFKLLIKVKL